MLPASLNFARMSQTTERGEAILQLPLTAREFEIIDKWRGRQGLKNEGVGRRLVELAREELIEEGNDELE